MYLPSSFLTNINGLKCFSCAFIPYPKHLYSVGATDGYPYSQAYLINEIANGKIACCRLGSDRSHAVVLLGVDADAGKFIYYDPVLGGENNKAAFTEIYDPRIITKK